MNAGRKTRIFFLSRQARHEMFKIAQAHGSCPDSRTAKLADLNGRRDPEKCRRGRPPWLP